MTAPTVTETPAAATAAPERWALAGLALATIAAGIVLALTQDARWLQVLGLTYVAVVGVWLAIIDFRTHLLPDRLILPSSGVLLALLVLYGFTTGDWGRIASAGLSAAFTGLVYAGMSRWGSLGQGDVKLGVLLSLLLGWFDWRAAVAGPILGFLLGAIAAVVLLAIGKGRKAHLAFGPYLILGALVTAAFQLQ